MAALAIPPGSRVYLDSNLLIYAVERIAPYHTILQSLFERFDRDELTPVTSELSLAEVLVKPFQADSVPDQEAYQALLSENGLMEVVPIDRDILVAAAKLRAKQKILLPDAIHTATATQAACDYFLTNDHRLRALPGLRVLLLSDHVTPTA